MNREKELINALHKEVCKQISFKMGSNASYTQKQILNIAIYASVEHISAEAASNELEGMPSADDVLYHMNKQNLNTIQSCVDSLMSYSIRRARKHFRIPIVTDISF